jgi:hypothetical protein
MKRRLLLLALAVLGVTLLALSACDADQPTDPATTTDASFEVTTEGLVTNTFQLKATCGHGVTGSVRYIILPGGATAAFTCPGGTTTVAAAGVTGFKVDFINLIPAPSVPCGQVTYSVAGGDIPVRTKCTVNGRDVGGKPLAKMVIKYVK